MVIFHFAKCNQFAEGSLLSLPLCIEYRDGLAVTPLSKMRHGKKGHYPQRTFLAGRVIGGSVILSISISNFRSPAKSQNQQYIVIECYIDSQF